MVSLRVKLRVHNHLKIKCSKTVLPKEKLYIILYYTFFSSICSEINHIKLNVSSKVIFWPFLWVVISKFKNSCLLYFFCLSSSFLSDSVLERRTVYRAKRMLVPIELHRKILSPPSSDSQQTPSGPKSQRQRSAGQLISLSLHPAPVQPAK